ncbi:variant leucine-rich repeat-containing protein [Bifidobacterium leontopitheci]|uniref:Leucine rich repeat variant domain-containing protein n=1 Tax=Bifidobacterium leontopitheci TaxID=2650774 RepID=A0A6I1GEY4_9BIFI|nr:hypothetical protein [Bifidobacterium leontopitheci]KAB7790184.1 hypothetical protein F7D09_1320 [Bifidobacterium leontopitheci]
MVDYEKAVATVQDPNADPVLLAKIAYENPEFGANVAVNARCYPGLKRWLATFGDERARETLAQMGITAEDGPVQDAAEAAAPAEAAAQAEPQQQAAFQDYSAQQQYAAAAQQPAQDAYAQQQAQYAAAQAAQQPAFQQAEPQQAQPAASNPYGYTPQLALETTDQDLIAKIAQYASQYEPTLLPYIARNPNTYPALVDWLAQLNDPAINAALATRQ